MIYLDLNVAIWSLTPVLQRNTFYDLLFPRGDWIGR